MPRAYLIGPRVVLYRGFLPTIVHDNARRVLWIDDDYAWLALRRVVVGPCSGPATVKPAMRDHDWLDVLGFSVAVLGAFTRYLYTIC